jgi:hypothetical protein
LATLHLSAFNKQVNWESNLLDDVVVNIKGHKRISSTVCSLSFKQEIAVPMACLYLLQGSPFYKSHEFAMLFIRHLLDILMDAYIMEASFVRLKNGDVPIYTPTINYSCCPNLLEHLSLYEFTSIY